MVWAFDVEQVPPAERTIRKLVNVLAPYTLCGGARLRLRLRIRSRGAHS